MTMTMRSWIALSALALGACAAETSSPAVADHFEVVQGAAQKGALGRTLDSLVVMRLVDDRGDPMPGISVDWSVSTGGGSVEILDPTTSADGLTFARWTFGQVPGAQALRVMASGVPSFDIAIEPQGFAALAVAVTAHAVCAIDTTQATWCWGDVGFYGEGPSYGNAPVLVDSVIKFKAIAGGNTHFCALATTGEAWCWGQVSGGALGTGPGQVTSLAPKQVVGGHQFATITAGDGTSCALDAGGQAWCWGTPRDGSLGVGAVTATAPAPVIQGSTAFTTISLGYEHICALDTNAKAWCWGHEDVGQLGDSLGRESNVPQQVSGGQSFREISAGDHFTCAIDMDRALWCWGTPELYPFRSYATPTPLGVQGIGRVLGDVYFMVGVRSGRPVAAGSSWFTGMPFELGTGRLTEIPGGLYSVTQIALRWTNFCMVRSDHQLFCVGVVPGYGTTSTPVGIPAP